MSRSILGELLMYYRINGAYVMEQFFRHLLITVYGVLFAALIAIPLGIFLAKRIKLQAPFIALANLLQTIPSLAMLSLLLIAMGLGAKTVVVTVMLYSLLPILKNTIAGIQSVSPSLIDVAIGMGMRPIERVIHVDLPLSVSIILSGIRNALIVGIGVTAIGTFIGAGGLGDIITRGINVVGGTPIILAGALPTALMAILIDLSLGWLERRLTPAARIKKR